VASSWALRMDSMDPMDSPWSKDLSSVIAIYLGFVFSFAFGFGFGFKLAHKIKKIKTHTATHSRQEKHVSKEKSSSKIPNRVKVARTKVIYTKLEKLV